MATRFKPANAALTGLMFCFAMTSAQASPTPGQYRIDSESVTRQGNGPMATETIQRVNGANGDTTVIYRSSVDGGRSATRVHRGSGPVLHCVEPYGAPRPSVGFIPCTPRPGLQDAAGGSHTASCPSAQLDERWRRLDNGSWERSLTVRETTGRISESSPHAAIAAAMAAMPAEQRAQAQAQAAMLPSQRQLNAANATLVATLEGAARSNNAQEAAVARQQLQALRGGQGSEKVTRLQERWTPTGAACTADR